MLHKITKKRKVIILHLHSAHQELHSTLHMDQIVYLGSKCLFLTFLLWLHVTSLYTVLCTHKEEPSTDCLISFTWLSIQ